MSLTLVSIMCNILSTLLKLTVSPVRLELTPSCVAPNHPRGLYYRGLAAHLTPQRRRRGGCRGDWDLCSSGFPHGRAPRTRADYVHAHAHTHTQARVAWLYSRATASVCYTRQQIEHLTLRLSAGVKPIKNADVKVAAGLADSAIQPT